MSHITLTKVYNPLDRSNQDTLQWQFVPGQTVADLLDHTGARLQLVQRETVELAVSINGQPIAPAHYTETRLVPGQHVTLIPVLTGGGGGGGKQIARMIGMVIIAIVATIVSYGVATSPTIAAMIGGTAATATTSASLGMLVLAGLAGSLVMVAGSLLLNALLPSGGNTTPALNGSQSISQSNSYSWNPQNTQQQGIAIPWPYGICKLNGNIIGTYREAIGTNQYMNILISLGEGPLSGLTDLKLNGQPLSNYRGVELHTRLGYLDQPVIPNFGDTRVEYPLGTKVVNGAPVIYSTVGQAFDTLEIEVSFPNGLYHVDAMGNLGAYSVDFSIEIKKQGDTIWSILTTQPYSHRVSAGGYWSRGFWLNTLIGTASPWIELEVGSDNLDAHYEGEYGENYFDPDGGSLIRSTTWRWLGETKIVTEIQNFVTVTGQQTGALRYTSRANIVAAGRYDIRITNLSVDQTDTRYSDDLYLTSVREIILDDFIYPGEALVGIRALATDQLSGSFSFECRTAGRLCRVYRNGQWYVEATDNPAWICFNILTQPIFDNGLNVLEYRAHNPSKLDLDRFSEWAEYCDDLVPDGSGGTEKRLTYNGPFDAVQNMWDAALAVSRIGRATPYWRGVIITVAIDKPTEPSALISVGNIGLDSFEETFLGMENRAGSIEADFLNLGKDLVRDKFTVINPDAPAGWGSASLSLQGVIRDSEVWRHCRYHLATTQYLTRVVTGQMDIDAIAFTLGNVIWLQHDVPMWGEGGRIVAATATTVTLDKDVTFNVGTSYSIMIRLLDNTVVERTVVGYEDPEIHNVLAVAIPFAAIPEPYDVYAFGELDRSVKPMRVIGIDPAGDLKRRITLTDYNKTIWNSDLLQPVLPTVNYSAATMPTVQGLSATERMVLGSDGTVNTMLDVSWYPVPGIMVKNIEVLMDGSSFIIVGPSETSVAIPVIEGSAVTVQARVINWLGNAQPLEKAAIVTHTVLGKLAPPADMTGLSISFNSGLASLVWDKPADLDVNVSGAVVVAFTPMTADVTWRDATVLGRYSGISTGAVIPAMDGTYLVKAEDSGGRQSINAAMAVSNAPSLLALNEVETLTEDPAWSGTKTNCVVDADNLILTTSINIDDAPGDWDDAPGLIDFYGGVATSGEYEFSDIIDLGDIYTSIVRASIQASVFDASGNFDDRGGLFDDVAGLFDGGSGNEASAILFVAISQDGATWSDWQPFAAGEYKAQAFKFKLALTSFNSSFSILVSSATVTVDMPDRLQSGDATVPVGGLTVMFPSKFKSAAPHLAFTIYGAAAGDHVVPSSISATGMDLIVKDNANSAVEKQINWFAKAW